jgi:hypothetical protein
MVDMLETIAKQDVGFTSYINTLAPRIGPSKYCGLMKPDIGRLVIVGLMTISVLSLLLSRVFSPRT